MPTVLRFDGMRVVIYPNDHSPEHVHIIGADCEAVFELNCPDGPVKLRESYRFTPRRLRRLAEQITASLSLLCEAWEKIHESD